MNRTMGRVITLSSIGLATAITVAAACADQADANAFLVIFHEAQMDLSDKGVTANDCLVVFPDGRIHLERSAQVLPQVSKELKVYESSLETGQIHELKAILDDQRIVNLAPEVQPKLPLSTHWFRGFEAVIPRDGRVQSIGYFVIPKQDIPEAASNFIPDNLRESWKDSQMHLQPLQEWFHSVESMKLPLASSNEVSTLCVPPDKSD